MSTIDLVFEGGGAEGTVVCLPAGRSCSTTQFGMTDPDRAALVNAGAGQVRRDWLAGQPVLEAAAVAEHHGGSLACERGERGGIWDSNRRAVPR